MEFKNTKELIYKNCAERIYQKQQEKNISNRKIYRANPKIIGQILKCKTDPKRNKYLIQYAVLDAIKEKLEFKSYQDILWGSQEEIIDYLPALFQSILFDLLLTSNDYKETIDKILCRYVPYARYSAYYHLLIEEKTSETGERFKIDKYIEYMMNSTIAYLYPEYKDAFAEKNIEMDEHIEYMMDSAIAYLYSECKDAFQSCFLSFTKTHDSFTYLDRQLENWIKNDLINLLKEYNPSENALGIRIRNLINSNYLYMTQSNNNSDIASIQQLIIATEKYIQELEKIQTNHKNQTFFC